MRKHHRTAQVVGGMLIASLAVLNARDAHAEATWLDCNASGDAGSVRFRFAFDEAARQASTFWEPGGGWPYAPAFGETGTDAAGEVIIDIGTINARFFRSTIDDPYTYRVIINRTSQRLDFYRYNGTLRNSVGSCALGQKPAGRAF